MAGAGREALARDPKLRTNLRVLAEAAKRGLTENEEVTLRCVCDCVCVCMCARV